MEEITKITHTKNMNTFNFNSTFNMTIDENANIKTVIDTNSYLYDCKVECGNGKAIFTGKIGIKILYLDTDNLTNTLSDSQSFNETITDGSITADTFINISNYSISDNILSTDGSLKINCEISVSPVAYINLALKNSFNESEILITKKSEISTSTITNFVNTKFEYVTNLETNDNISKLLSCNCYFSAEKTTAEDGFVVVDGKLTTSILYETTENDDLILKEIRDVSNVKYDVEINGLNKTDSLDLSFVVDKSHEEIKTEIEDKKSSLLIKNQIDVCGVTMKNISIDLIDDVYSTENEIESSTNKREYTKKAENYSLAESISNETTISSEEPAIDEIVANLNIVPNITNTYVKNDHIFLEGIITSNLTFIDENKELKHKKLEMPFVIDSKIKTSTLGCVHHNISIIDSKVKVKRGTIIEMEYSIYLNMFVYEKETHEIVDNFKIGKQLDFSKYDFQIFIAKQGESLWDLCKRIKISPNDIKNYNKDLPLIMEGGEKVIIKR